LLTKTDSGHLLKKNVHNLRFCNFEAGKQLLKLNIKLVEFLLVEF